jgi:hypothetical protein
MIKFKLDKIDIEGSDFISLNHQLEAAYKFNNGKKFLTPVYLELVLSVPLDSDNGRLKDIEKEVYKTIKRIALSEKCASLFIFKIKKIEIDNASLYLELNPGIIIN